MFRKPLEAVVSIRPRLRFLLPRFPAACSVCLAFVANKHGINTDGISVLANVLEDANGIQGFNLRITVPMQTTPEARAVMERAVRSCPVAKALSPSLEKHIVWSFAE